MRCGNVLLLMTVSVWYAETVEDATHWRRLAKDDVIKHVYTLPNTNVAKNVVLMIGDGMGISTVTAARILKGQLSPGSHGEETVLRFEEFPYTGLSKTYSVNKQVPDSAATATCMLTGVKTLNSVIGVDSDVTHGKCKDLTNHKLQGMMHWSMEAGKSVGLVTTARVTHATPAAMYAATVNRDWEDDRDVPHNSGIPFCTDIAAQLVHNNSGIQVILGGGRRNFIPATEQDPISKLSGFRQDGQNLIQAWKDDKLTRNASHSLAYTKEEFDTIDPNTTDYMLGLFTESHMSYDNERDSSQEPSLADMTRKAVQVLQRNSQGFFLMVEGARIDHGHHDSKARSALYDLLAFEEAVSVISEMTNEEDTLVVVTADHSHTMTISGYADRGNKILDIVREDRQPVLDNDLLPYTTLSYANGRENVWPRQNLTNIDTSSPYYRQASAIPLVSETHSGEDVAIYARGPMAHLVTGVKEQNVIAYVMAHAACVGNTGIPCDSGRFVRQSGTSDTKDKSKNHRNGDKNSVSVLKVNFHLTWIMIVILLCFSSR